MLVSLMLQEDALLGEHGLTIGLAVGVVTVLVVGSNFAPIVPRGEGGAATPGFAENAATEHAYCAQNLSDVDCGCFAGRAGEIMSHQGLDIRGADRIDRAELARMQALESC